MKTFVYIIAWGLICSLIAVGVEALTGWDRQTVMINLYGLTWAYLAFEIHDLRERHQRLRAAAENTINVFDKEGPRG